MKRTWMMASSERAWKVRLTSVKHGLKGRLARRPARRIAALNHSHFSALSGGLLLLCGGDWEPLLGSPPPLAARPGGTTVARYVTYSAGHTACHHSHLMVPAPVGVLAEPARLSTLPALHSASGLPSLCAGGECMRAAPVSGAPRSRRTSRPLLCTLHPCASSLLPTSHWTLRAF